MDFADICTIQELIVAISSDKSAQCHIKCRFIIFSYMHHFLYQVFPAVEKYLNSLSKNQLVLKF